jgi:DNA-binding NarL/FixJ family response regulator
VTAAAMPPVIICDDHPVVRECLAGLLAGSQISVVASCSTVDELLQLAAQYPTAIIVTDLGVSDWTSPDLIKALVGISNQLKIVVFSGRWSPLMMEQCYKLGAVSYLPKTAMPDEIVKALQYAAKGKAYFNTDVASTLLELNTERQSIEAALTKKEMSFFLSYVRGESPEQIAETSGVTTKSVQNALSGISGKLGRHRSELVDLARETGYLDSLQLD